MSKKKQTRRAYNVKEEQYDAITKLAEEQGRSRSSLLEEWINEKLDSATGKAPTKVNGTPPQSSHFSF
jgi:hypothetical protein